jgi:hypothetical protein
MKTKIIGGGIFHLAKYVLFFSIILLLSCTSISGIRLEGSDFEENLPGLWDGYWSHQSGRSGKQRINITGIDGNKVHLTGFYAKTQNHPDTDEVYGRIENSTLFLTWPIPEVEEEYRMKRDDSNNLTLEGNWKGITSSPRTHGLRGWVQFKKIK